MAFVYGVSVIIAALWGARMVIYGKILIRRTPFDIPVVLYLISQILSTFFSIDQHVSLFGYYSRFHGGLLSLIAYTLLFFAISSNRDLISRTKLLSVTLFAGTLVALYGIAEKFGIDKHMWVQDVQARVFSSFGQPNWLAAYIAILIPLTFILLLKKYKKNDLGFVSQHIPILLVSICAILYTCLLFTKSRSGFLGFWIGNGIFWGSVYVRERFFSTKVVFGGIAQKYSPTLILGVIVNVAFLILNFGLRTPFGQYNQRLTLDVFEVRDEKVVEIMPTSGSALENDSVTDSADIRRIVWKGAIAIIREYPLFGTGPETFAFAYYKYRPVEHNLTSEWDFLYNRAHNEFLNIGATSGIVGLSAYLLLLISVLYGALKILLKKETGSALVASAVLACYVATAVTNFFGFSVVMIGIFLYILPLLLVLDKKSAESTFHETPYTSRQWILLAGCAFISLGGVLWVVQLWRADSMYATASVLRRAQQPLQAYGLINTALTIRPREPVYWDEKTQISMAISGLALEDKNATLSAEFAKEAIESSKEALTISPQNVNFWKTRTRMLFQFSDLDPTFAQDALDSIRVAQSLAPTDVKIMYNVAVIQAGMDDIDDAIVTLEKCLELKPNYKDAYLTLAVLFKRQKNVAKGIEVLKTGLKKVSAKDGELLEKLAELETATPSSL